MAEKLKRTYGLTALEVMLDADRAQPHVAVALANWAGGQRTELLREHVRLAEFGSASSTSDAPWSIAAPPNLIDRLAPPMFDLFEDGPPDPLWLHLVKPYGYLGAVPWEQALVAAIESAVVRLPDVLPQPKLVRPSPRVAICLNPGPPSADGGAQLLQEVVTALDGALGQPATVDVFTSPDFALDPQTRAVRSHVIVHSSDPGIHDWLAWMLDTLSMEVVDVVVFVCPSIRSGATGMLQFPSTPDGSTTMTTPANPPTLQRFLVKMGGHLAVFVDVGLGDPAGLRLVADELGAHRAGPVVLAEGPHVAESLEARFRFFLGDGSFPAADEHGFAYVQPAMIEETRQVVSALAPPVEPVYKAAEDQWAGEMPAWVSVAEQYLAEQTATLGQLYRQMQTTGGTTRKVMSRAQGLEESLQRLQQIVADHEHGTPA